MSERWSVSHAAVSDPATPWTAARQAPLSMEFSRQERWSGLPFPSPGDLPHPGSPALQADSLPREPPGHMLRLYTNPVPIYMKDLNISEVY